MNDDNGMRQTDTFGGSFPKIAPLPGSLHLERRRCGRPNCRCTHGQLHGPYAYHIWYEQGRRHKAYVPRHRLTEVMAGLDAWQALHPPAWTMRQLLAELHAIEQEVLQ